MLNGKLCIKKHARKGVDPKKHKLIVKNNNKHIHMLCKEKKNG